LRRTEAFYPMESKLQELTQSIYREGVEKARQEGADLLAKAKLEADKLLQTATHEAANLVEAAKTEAITIRQRAQAELKTVAAQSLALFKQELVSSLEQAAIRPPLQAILADKAVLLSLIQNMMAQWNPQTTGQNLRIQFSEHDKTTLQDFFTSAANKLLFKGVELSFDGRFAEGFKIGPADGSYVVSCTEQALTALFQSNLKIKTKDLLFPEL